MFELVIGVISNVFIVSSDVIFVILINSGCGDVVGLILCLKMRISLIIMVMVVMLELIIGVFVIFFVIRVFCFFLLS